MIKKKIIIFTSAGGNGHMSVTRALMDLLEQRYDIKYVYAYTDVLQDVDFFQWLTKKRICGEDVYNYCLQKKWIFMIHFFFIIGRWYFWLYKKKTLSLLNKYLLEHKPDLIISVMPLINGALLHSAKNLNIPFLLIPTDLDTTTFMYEIDKILYKKFKIIATFNDPDVLKTVPAYLHKEHIVFSRFPIRKDFFTHKDTVAIKNKWAVPVNKKIVLVMMGGQGSYATLLFAQELAHVMSPIHLIVCIGNFTTIENALTAINFPDHITITIVKFTHEIADLMAIADIIITKSGSVSFCEALYSGKPIVLDGTSSTLLWEEFNHTFLKKYTLGDIIYNIKDTPRLIEKILHNNELVSTYADNINAIIRSEHQNNQAIQDIIHTMLENAR
jgi:processive 1,2-diacylglycerol beta-glucosyltransferase